MGKSISKTCYLQYEVPLRVEVCLIAEYLRQQAGRHLIVLVTVPCMHMKEENCLDTRVIFLLINCYLAGNSITRTLLRQQHP